ncbi:hypothetical protein [Streptomyces sp. NPDC050738]|uniref:hypothetical protein n=1 Tax=Streptomyces sp. NPDC050738 TaxID=3154744 RepID=UPI0034311959
MEKELHGLLRHAVTSGGSTPGQVLVTELRDGRVGVLTVSYCTTHIRTDEVHTAPEAMTRDLLLDDAGRPINFTYGLVQRTPAPSGYVPDPDAMELAREAALSAYRGFALDLEDQREPQLSEPVAGTAADPAGPGDESGEGNPAPPHGWLSSMVNGLRNAFRV